jgi:rhodanese-related sulfurtransferase
MTVDIAGALATIYAGHALGGFAAAAAKAGPDQMENSPMFSKLFSGSSGQADPRTVSHDALERALSEGACALVDVREPAEFASGHIANAINLPLSQFDPARLPADKPVVLVCRSGGRSAKALDRALDSGRSDVRHYAGGVMGWQANGGPLIK